MDHITQEKLQNKKLVMVTTAGVEVEEGMRG